MWRRAVQVAAGLLCLHATLTFGLALTVFPGSPFERMAFAQHGFNFVFLALLNLALLLPVAPALRTAVLVADLVFCVNNAVFVSLKPEPPLVVALILTVITTICAFVWVRAAPRLA